MCTWYAKKLGNRWFALARWFRGGFNNNSSRLQRHHEAVPLENPVGFIDCQRHRSSPIWKQVRKHRNHKNLNLSQKYKYKHTFKNISICACIFQNTCICRCIFFKCMYLYMYFMRGRPDEAWQSMVQCGCSYTFFLGQIQPSSSTLSPPGEGQRSRMQYLLPSGGRSCMRSVEWTH